MGLLGAARGLLAHLVPGQGARSAADFDAAARDAYRGALKVQTATPVAPPPHLPRATDDPAVEEIRIAEAPALRLPITRYAPASRVADDYRAVADELLGWLGDLSST